MPNSRIDVYDPDVPIIIFRVTQPEYDAILAVLSTIGGREDDVGDGIRLINVEGLVLARFRIDRSN